MYDAASTILAQKLSQVDGVGQVHRRRQRAAGGARRAESDGAQQVRHRPRGRAHRARARPTPTARRAARRTATSAWEIDANDQLLQAPTSTAADRRLPQRRRRSACRDVGRRRRLGRGPAQRRLANGKPAVLLIIFRQPGANIIETVDRVQALLPAAARVDPAGDRPRRWRSTARTTIRASVRDVELTLLIVDRARGPRGVRVPAQRRARRSSPASRCRSR